MTFRYKSFTNRTTANYYELPSSPRSAGIPPWSEKTADLVVDSAGHIGETFSISAKVHDHRIDDRSIE